MKLSTFIEQLQRIKAAVPDLEIALSAYSEDCGVLLTSVGKVEYESHCSYIHIRISGEE